jgi:hypothetical protein
VTEKKTEQLELLMTASLQKMANQIYNQIPDGWAFCIMICDCEEDGTVLYASNADKNDMVSVIEGWLKDFKAENYRIPDRSELDNPQA